MEGGKEEPNIVFMWKYMVDTSAGGLLATVYINYQIVGASLLTWTICSIYYWNVHIINMYFHMKTMFGSSLPPAIGCLLEGLEFIVFFVVVYA
jgi:hypothetical protein